MKHFKKLTVTVTCIALAGAVSAGAVCLPSVSAQNSASPVRVTAQGKIPASLQQLLNRLCGNRILFSTPASRTDTTQTPSTDTDTSTPTTDTTQATETTTPSTSTDTDTTSTTPTASDASYVEQVVQLVNKERTSRGLQALTIDSAVQAAAQVRAEEQAQSFSHTRPNGTSCFTALDAQSVSYRSAGENIAYGQQTPEEVMTAWMNSEGHRANILNKGFTTIGVGYASINGQSYWAQMFIS